MLRAIKMCLRPIVANGDITPRLLVSLGCASGTNFTSGNITSLSHFGKTFLLIFMCDIC